MRHDHVSMQTEHPIALTVRRAVPQPAAGLGDRLPFVVEAQASVHRVKNCHELVAERLYFTLSSSSSTTARDALNFAAARQVPADVSPLTFDDARKPP